MVVRLAIVGFGLIGGSVALGRQARRGAGSVRAAGLIQPSTSFVLVINTHVHPVSLHTRLSDVPSVARL